MLREQNCLQMVLFSVKQGDFFSLSPQEMLGLTKTAASGQQGRPLAPQDAAAASCKYG